MIIDAILLLGGTSTRFYDKDFYKQYYKINDVDLFVYPLFQFVKNTRINRIFLVVDKDHIEYVKETVSSFKFEKEIYIVEGGPTRQLSVFNGLLAINNLGGSNYVLIHDAARPLITQKIIDDNIDSVIKNDVVTTYLPIFDSLIYLDKDKKVTNYVKRENFYKIQTPQSFRFDIIYASHLDRYLQNDVNYNDDVQLIRGKGILHFVLGSEINLKVTTKDDLELVKLHLMRNNEF